MWRKYSQAIIYRLPDVLPDLKKDAKKPVPKKSKPK